MSRRLHEGAARGAHGRHARAVDPSIEAWDSGRFLERWADPGALSALERAYAHYDLRDVARALWETIDLFQLLEEETARRLGLAWSSTTRIFGARWPTSCAIRGRGDPLTVRRALLLAVLLVCRGLRRDERRRP